MTQSMIDLIRAEYLSTKQRTQVRSPYAFGMSVDLESYCLGINGVDFDTVQARVDNHVTHLMKQVEDCNEALKLAIMHREAVKDLEG